MQRCQHRLCTHLCHTSFIYFIASKCMPNTAFATHIHNIAAVRRLSYTFVERSSASSPATHLQSQQTTDRPTADCNWHHRFCSLQMYSLRSLLWSCVVTSQAREKGLVTPTHLTLRLDSGVSAGVDITIVVLISLAQVESGCYKASSSSDWKKQQTLHLLRLRCSFVAVDADKDDGSTSCTSSSHQSYIAFDHVASRYNLYLF